MSNIILNNSTLLFTSKGLKMVNDINKNEFLVDVDNNHILVLDKEQVKQDAYSITFNDNTTLITTSEQSIWALDKNETPCQISINKLVNDKNLYKDYSFPIPYPKYCNFPNKEDGNNNDLPIDPYILGLLIGDGCFKMHQICFYTAEDELKYQFIAWALNNKYKIRIRTKKHHEEIYICCKNDHNETASIKKQLAELGLLNLGSREKFIPDIYKKSSTENRLKLLAGLINTDGTTNLNRPSYKYFTYSKQLAEDIQQLAQSLGYVSTLHQCDRTSEKSTKKYPTEIQYSLTFISNDNFNLLNRFISTKHRLRIQERKKEFKRMITKIEKINGDSSFSRLTLPPCNTILAVNAIFYTTQSHQEIREKCIKIIEDNYKTNFTNPNAESKLKNSMAVATLLYGLDYTEPPLKFKSYELLNDEI